MYFEPHHLYSCIFPDTEKDFFSQPSKRGRGLFPLPPIRCSFCHFFLPSCFSHLLVLEAGCKTDCLIQMEMNPTVTVVWFLRQSHIILFCLSVVCLCVACMYVYVCVCRLCLTLALQSQVMISSSW